MGVSMPPPSDRTGGIKTDVVGKFVPKPPSTPPPSSKGQFGQRPVHLAPKDPTSQETAKVTDRVLKDEKISKGHDPHKVALSAGLAKEAASRVAIRSLQNKPELHVDTEGVASPASPKLTETFPSPAQLKGQAPETPKPGVQAPSVSELPTAQNLLKKKTNKINKEAFISSIENGHPDDHKTEKLKATLEDLNKKPDSAEKWGDLYRMMAVYERRKDGVAYLNSLPISARLKETLEQGKELFSGQTDKWAHSIGENFGGFAEKLATSQASPRKTVNIPKRQISPHSPSSTPPVLPRRPPSPPPKPSTHKGA